MDSTPKTLSLRNRKTLPSSFRSSTSSMMIALCEERTLPTLMSLPSRYRIGSPSVIPHRTTRRVVLCTTRVVHVWLWSGHLTTARVVKKNCKNKIVPFRPSLTPFLGTPSPGPKLSFFLLQKKIPSATVLDKGLP